MNVREMTSEWLETNGIGGYASSTVSGSHTRKYHGLLVSRLESLVGKFVLLSKLEDSVFYNGEERLMTAHRYGGGAMVPAQDIPVTFELKHHPVFHYRFGPVTVLKEIALVQGEDTVLVRYTCTKNRPGARLRVKPLIAYRDFHGLVEENMFLRVRTFPVERGFVMSPYEGMPPLHMQVSGNFQFYPSPTWYRRFEYTEEQRRGFDGLEDLFCPGVFEIDLDKSAPVILSASTELKGDLEALWRDEMSARERRARSHRGTPLGKALRRAARQFVSRNQAGDTAIVAGFPWFLEWGRDAMIALPGLLLNREGIDTYRDVLQSFARHQRQGIIPNFLGNTPQENAYNSADAALWFAWAVQQYQNADIKGRGALPDIVLRALSETFHHYRKGTDHGIGIRDDGLLRVGSPDEQVTWMDANAYGRPVTPRWGCPVEINALWYNFVRWYAANGKRLKLPWSDEAAPLAGRIRESFNRCFWHDERRYLADVVQGETVDDTLRPNQIFAVSLEYSPLDKGRSQCVVNAVRSELKTPFGLRTLARSDPRYRPRYEGGPGERDTAYHNGTVWPWLLGHYGEAVLKVTDDPWAAVAELEACFEAFEAHLEVAGIGTVSEIFDAETPHTPRGCIGQAWSVAEVSRLHALVEKTKMNLSKERSRCAS